MHLFDLIVLPSLIAMMTLMAFGWAMISLLARFGRGIATVSAILALAFLSLVGLKGLFYAAGTDWRYFIAFNVNALAIFHTIKYTFFCILVFVLWLTRRFLLTTARLLGSLGYAFVALACLKIVVLLWNNTHLLSADTVALNSTNAELASSQSREPAAHPTRRVIWVIFDEADYDRMYKAATVHHIDDGGTFVPRHFIRLAERGVFSTDAKSPASATLYSIPALLTGKPISGSGVKIDKQSAVLSLEQADRRFIQFGENTTIFGKLYYSGLSASVLGFYHPYCRLFRLTKCDSFPWPDVGAKYAGLLANAPDFVLKRLPGGDEWVNITRRELQLLPQYLKRDDALTFVHINVPHLPASYADKQLQLAVSNDPLTEYTHNLWMADLILGRILDEVQGQASRHESILIVSTDHWLRNRWYKPGAPDISSPIPFTVWKVGETDGHVLSAPLSTVHTADMILDYLDGKITSQADIAKWWEAQPSFPSYIVPVE